MLVVPELEPEINVLNRNKGLQDELFEMRKQRDSVEDQIERIQWKLDQIEQAREGEGEGGEGKGKGRGEGVAMQFPKADRDELVEKLAVLRQEYQELREGHGTKLKAFHSEFHPVWGLLLKTGYQNSRFSNQIHRFACLYTSHVGNLRYYSPNKSYRGLQDEMPHDTIAG